MVKVCHGFARRFVGVARRWSKSYFCIRRNSKKEPPMVHREEAGRWANSSTLA